MFGRSHCPKPNGCRRPVCHRGRIGRWSRADCEGDLPAEDFGGAQLLHDGKVADASWMSDHTAVYAIAEVGKQSTSPELFQKKTKLQAQSEAERYYGR